MPPTLHPYLKRGVDFDVSPIDPNDLLEDLPEHHDAQSQTAKRRRVEAIALQYLRGRPPLILTARLKGPFTKEWRNPWAKDVQPQTTRESRHTNNPIVEAANKKPRTSQVASPEASRAVGGAGGEQLYSQLELEPLPATAPMPDDDDLSSAINFSSLDTEQFVANNSPTNPFWLRRPVTSITFPPNSQTDKSPTRQRKKGFASSTRKSLQLAPPKERLGGRPLPIRATPPDELRSSASASMGISSTATLNTAVQYATNKRDPLRPKSPTDIPISPRLREDSVQEEEARNSQAAQCAQTAAAAETPLGLQQDLETVSHNEKQSRTAPAQSFGSLVPATTYKPTSTVQVPQSSPIRPSREAIQRPAEQLISRMPRSATKKYTPSKEIGLPKNLRHDMVASPAPDSSTGFMYRRVGQPRAEGNISKARPRAVDLSPSPTPEKKEQGADLPTKVPEENALVIEADKIEQTVVNSSIEPARNRDDQTHKEQIENTTEEPPSYSQEEQHESYKSKQSQYSTQAAMLLAQLEFQDDSSQSSTSSATLRPWSQPAQNTPPPPLLQPSPAITPLSVFNPRKDSSFEDFAGENEIHGPLVSTQDLFNAASPFAFSTVKKSRRSRRTSLRYAITSRLTEHTSVKSPTPSAERVPLKNKNITTVWSFAHEKSVTSRSIQRTANDVGLPELDFHTSLDFGLNADFTDYFLKGLDNEPC